VQPQCLLKALHAAQAAAAVAVSVFCVQASTLCRATELLSLLLLQQVALRGNCADATMPLGGS
jgi:hypothetical protein